MSKLTIIITNKDSLENNQAIQTDIDRILHPLYWENNLQICKEYFQPMSLNPLLRKLGKWCNYIPKSIKRLLGYNKVFGKLDGVDDKGFYFLEIRNPIEYWDFASVGGGFQGTLNGSNYCLVKDLPDLFTIKSWYAIITPDSKVYYKFDLARHQDIDLTDCPDFDQAQLLIPYENKIAVVLDCI